MFNHQFFVSLKRAMRLETVKHFVQVHQDRIKTVALPLLVIAAVLFFWIYGNVQDGESIRVEDAAADAQQTEDVQDGGTAGADAAEQTPQGDIYVDICGEVVRPGVYQIASGTRLFEVIAQAGGLKQQKRISTSSIRRRSYMTGKRHASFLMRKPAERDCADCIRSVRRTGRLAGE